MESLRFPFISLEDVMNKCYIWVCSCVFAISFAGAAAWASPMEIHSSDGNGGESYVLTFSIPDHHINGTV